MQTESKPISDNEQDQGPKTDKFTPPYLQKFEGEPINVYELWIIIWNKKWWAIAVTALAALGSMVYTGFQPPVQPVYKTEALLQEPRAEDIQLLNAQIEDVIERFEVDFYGKYGLRKITKAGVFVDFKKNLSSRTLQNKFIKENGMIELLTPQRTLKTKDEDLYKSFVEMIKIEHGKFTSIFIELNDSRNVEKLINAYIDFTDGETVHMLVEKIQNSLQQAIKKEIEVVNKEIIRLRESSKKRREDELIRIHRYEEAAQIATRLGIKDRAEPECSSNIFREPNYCLGFRTLGIEIEFLKKRKFVDPTISTILKLEQKVALLQTPRIKEEGFHAVSIYKSSHQSIIDNEPNRIRIVAIVTFVGLFSGIFLIYFVAFVENQRKKYSAKSATLVE